MHNVNSARWLQAGAGCLLAAFLGCAPAGPPCAEVPLEPLAVEQLATVRSVLDFEPTLPCSTVRDVAVTAIIVDAPAGDSRITFVVTGDRSKFTFSQARAVAPFRAIPQGTSPIEWTVSGIAVTGFEGASGSGSSILYVRWSAGGIVYELQATYGGQFAPASVKESARTNIAKSANRSDADRD